MFAVLLQLLYGIVVILYNAVPQAVQCSKIQYYAYLVLLLVLYSFCPIQCYSTVTPESVQARTPLSVSLVKSQQRLQPPAGHLLVSTIDGQLHALNLQNGEYLWTYNSTHTLLSSTQQQFNTNDNTVEQPFVIPAVDGTLYFVGTMGIQKLPITVDELVANAPFRTKDNTRFIGHKHTTAILFNKLTGEIHNNFQSVTPFTDIYNDKCNTVLNDTNLLWVGKTDMNVRALDGRTGIERWNVSISQYSSMYDATERELTIDELDQLHMPKFAVGVDGTLLALDLNTQQEVWSYTLPSAVTNIHFIPHIGNSTFDSTNTDNINDVISDPSDMMRVPHYYFDPNDANEASNTDYVTAAINHYYRQLHNAAQNDLMYIGQMNNGFYYALPTAPAEQYSLATSTNNVITPPDWQRTRNNQITTDNTPPITPAATDCTPLNENYPACLTGFHVIDSNIQSNMFHPPLAIGTSNIYNSFLPAILPPNYTDTQSLITNTDQSQYPYLLPSPPTFWSTYMPIVLTSTVVSLSITLPLLAAMYVYRRNDSNKRKKKKKLRLKSQNTDNVINSPVMSPIKDYDSEQKEMDVAEYMNDMLTNNIDNNDSKDNSDHRSNTLILPKSNSIAVDSVSTGSQRSNDGITLPIRQPSGVAGQFILNKMIIDTNTVLGTGSMGTVVYAGQFEGRICAIKRLVKPFYGDADKEIALLIATDTHPNMLRYYAKEEDNDFVYIAVERCAGTLNDFVNNIEHVAHHNKQQILYDIMNGLAHLHALNIVHRDLKPANILLNSHHRAKISDMGLGKKLDLQRSSFDSLVSGSVGWQPPEVLRANGITRLTKAVDIFSAGCVIYYVLTNGKHPFGDTCEREYHILQGKIDTTDIQYNIEACDLIYNMCHLQPNKRITADDTLTHPFFWSNETRLQFLNDVSDRIEIETCTYSLIRLTIEQNAADIVGTDWSTVLHPGLLDSLSKYRKYDYSTIRDLLRVIRNKKNHYNELSLELQHALGSIPNGYYTYFSSKWPKLLLYIYCKITNFIVESTTLPFIISATQPICHIQTNDMDKIDLTAYNNMTWNTKLCDITEIQLNSVFRHYFGQISLKRLVQLQQLSKLHYRTYYMKATDWCQGINQPNTS